MAEDKDKDKKTTPIRRVPRQTLKDWAIYVVSVTNVSCRAETAEQAKDWAMRQVMDRLRSVDTNVYIPKVAVMEKGVDEETKEHLAKAEAPWLADGSGIKPFEDPDGNKEEKPS